MKNMPLPPKPVYDALRQGQVIPAHPLALNEDHTFDEAHQKALTRYYLASGVGGLAIGVHTTQFEIRRPEFGLLKPVLELATETIREHELKNPGTPIIRIAGICGTTQQAAAEASLARDLGYHFGMLSLTALKEATNEQLIDHAQSVAEIIPLMGFYLQTAVGGRFLDYAFWRELCEIPNVLAIKIAPFNRYQTLDVVRAVADSGRTDEITLYTGNDDNIILDLLTTYEFQVNGEPVQVRIKGGLLGHWACWTKKAVEQFETIQKQVENHTPIPQDLLTLAAQVTDSNAAFFDPHNRFAGCIAGVNEVLRRQGLMKGRWCLNPKEDLSPGQMDEINRVYTMYPHLNDDDFVAKHLDEWLK